MDMYKLNAIGVTETNTMTSRKFMLVLSGDDCAGSAGVSYINRFQAFS